MPTQGVYWKTYTRKKGNQKSKLQISFWKFHSNLNSMNLVSWQILHYINLKQCFSLHLSLEDNKKGNDIKLKFPKLPWQLQKWGRLDPISTSNDKNPNELINPLHSYMGKLISNNVLLASSVLCHFPKPTKSVTHLNCLPLLSLSFSQFLFLLSARATSLCFHYQLPSRIVVVKEGEIIWVFGVRVWFKREEGIWG